MQRGPQILYWRRTDVSGLERLELCVSAHEIVASSTVICLEDGGFRMDHRWQLTPAWRAKSLEVERWGAGGAARLRLERTDRGWAVDGVQRPDLDEAEEPDLSVTPFCNTLPIRRMPVAPGASLSLDTAYIDGAAMTVIRSKQRYERVSRDRLRYVDLGLSAGFEAEIEVDDQGLVVRYENLFERVQPD